MKHLKLLGLVVVAAMALIAIPADSATAGSVFCTATESPCKESNRWAVGTELDFSITSGSSSSLTATSGETIDTCTGSTAKGKIERAEAVTASIESLTWSGCSFTTTTLKAGKLEVTKVAGTSNGTVTSDEITEVTINTVLFGSCIYGVLAGNSLGDLTEGKPAVFHANTVPTKQSGSNFACPETSKWTATFTLTEPKEKTLSVGSGTISSSVFCAIQESPCPEADRWAAGTELDFSLKSGTSAQLTNTAGTETLDKCTESAAKGKIDKAEAVTASIESLTWSGCTFETTTNLFGKFEVEHIAETHNGTVRADGETRITINGGFFGSCLYGLSSGANLGELKEGKPATFAANAVVKKLTGSAAACPETAKWTAEYTLTEPKEKTLSVETGTKAGPGATVLCTTTEASCPEANRWAVGTELDFSIPAENSSLLTATSGEAIDTCTGSTGKGRLEKAEAVTASIESLTWSGCTFTTKTLKTGKLEVRKIAGTSNGTVTSDEITEVTINTVLFGSCIYGIKAGLSLGDLTEGKPAVFHANTVPTKQSGSTFACPETSKWTGTFTLTEPKEKTLSVGLS